MGSRTTETSDGEHTRTMESHRTSKVTDRTEQGDQVSVSFQFQSTWVINCTSIDEMKNPHRKQWVIWHSGTEIWVELKTDLSPTLLGNQEKKTLNVKMPHKICMQIKRSVVYKCVHHSASDSHQTERNNKETEGRIWIYMNENTGISPSMQPE